MFIYANTYWDVILEILQINSYGESALLINFPYWRIQDTLGSLQSWFFLRPDAAFPLINLGPPATSRSPDHAHLSYFQSDGYFQTHKVVVEPSLWICLQTIHLSEILFLLTALALLATIKHADICFMKDICVFISSS